MPLSPVNLPFGIQPDYKEGIFTARGGYVCEGYAYPLAFWGVAKLVEDDSAAYSMSVYGGPGGQKSIWANVAGGQTPSLEVRSQKAGFWVIALEKAEDTKSFRGLVYGITKAKVLGGRGQIALPLCVGSGMWVDTAGGGAGATGITVSDGPHLELFDLSGSTATSASIKKVVAIGLENVANSTTSVGTTAYVYFDGFHGVGYSGLLP